VVAVVFLLLMLGIANFGGAIYAYSSVSNVALDAARWASVRGDTSGPPMAGAPACNCRGSAGDVYGFVAADLSGLDSSHGELTVTPSWCQTGSPPVCSSAATTPYNSPGSTVTVVVQYNYTVAVPLMGSVTFPLTSTSQLVISQ